MRPVDRMATCKKCGDEQVAWLESRKGKWFLATAYRDGDTLVANPVDPHWKKCRGANRTAKYLEDAL